MRRFERAAGAAALAVATGWADAGTVTIDDFYDDLVAREGVALSADGASLYTTDGQFDPSDIAAGPTGPYAFGSGATGLATDAITGNTYRVLSSGIINLDGISSNIDSGVSNTTDIGALNGFGYVTTADNQLSITDLDSGVNTIIPWALNTTALGAAQVNGHSFLFANQGSNIFQYAINGDGSIGGLIDTYQVSGMSSINDIHVDGQGGVLYAVGALDVGSAPIDITIPTPGSLALGGAVAGMLGLGCRRRRRGVCRVAA